jgi:hypothetical protein
MGLVFILAPPGCASSIQEINESVLSMLRGIMAQGFLLGGIGGNAFKNK